MESYRVIHYENGLYRNGDHELIQEEPLLIRVDDKPYSIVIRTPGEEISHAAGFCLAEGLVDSWDEFARKELKMGAVDKDFIDVGRKKIRVVYYLHDGSRYYEANIDDEGDWNVHYQCYRAYRRGPGGIRKGTRGEH